jgi:putative transposase
MKDYILPYADILAYCLMPNHFHLMVLVHESNGSTTESDGATQSHPVTIHPNIAPINQLKKPKTLNDSIGIMLRSYTRAINKQENLTGNLFREGTKAECVNCPKGVSPSFLKKDGVDVIMMALPELQYPQVCFNYIHQNPVKAGLVKSAIDWEYSSAAGYKGLKSDLLIKRSVTEQYINLNIKILL